MIFGYYLFFENESSLNECSIEVDKKLHRYIRVLESKFLSLYDIFPLISEKFVLSGQEVYYYSQKPFEDADESFSWALEIKEVVFLIWDADKQQILYHKGAYYTAERLRFWIYHTFFPLVLELNQRYNIIHVGSVEIKEKPVLFSAFSYGGKSTLTNYFLEQGHTLISDDSLAIDKRENGFFAVPSYPYYRPFRKVETLGYYTDNFSQKIQKISIMYVLEKTDPKSEIVITEVKGIEKFKVFHYSSFIEFSFLKERRLHFFSDMAKQVAVYKISIPWDLKRLKEVYEAICTHTNSLK